VHQEIEFEFGQTDNQGKGDELENFWVVDAAIGYRLPKRYGLVSVEIKNLFNEDFQFQSSFDPDLEPRSSLFEPERAIFATLNLWFY
jgi:outer membrane receptor protein involved in Fe transport